MNKLEARRARLQSAYNDIMVLVPESDVTGRGYLQTLMRDALAEVWTSAEHEAEASELARARYVTALRLDTARQLLRKVQECPIGLKLCSRIERFLGTSRKGEGPDCE